jgi:trans-aconitate methyltransferase
VTTLTLMENRLGSKRTETQFAHEWDKLALLRADHILSGKDLSFTSILIPCIIDLSRVSPKESVIDVGCGIGVLSEILSHRASRVVGVDSSSLSIKTATDLYGDIPNIQFLNLTLSSFASRNQSNSFQLAIANMFLMNVPDLETTLSQLHDLLSPGGHLVFTVTHPCFWPFYWGYASEPWFRYNKEMPVESTFRISLESYGGLRSTHFHRPLEFYLDALRTEGFNVDHILEPMPSKELEAKYPQPWAFPRFLGVRCIRD